jgi:hypothetical protein
VTNGVDGSLVSSKHLLYKVKHPNPITGEPGTSGPDQETFGYNRLGERVYMRDQRSTVHAYTHDSRGRQTKDEVTAVGYGVVGPIRSIRTDYDSLDRETAVACWDLTLPRNQVKFEYGKWGELLREWQDHDGLVTPASPKTEVFYFESAPSGAVAKVRPQRVRYPSGTITSGSSTTPRRTTTSSAASRGSASAPRRRRANGSCGTRTGARVVR